MRVAVVGGSFNPPTIVHGQIGVEILRRKVVDEVWYAPSNRHPFAAAQAHKAVRASYEDRCRMVNELITDSLPSLKMLDGRMRLSTIEKSIEGECYTKNVIEALRTRHPKTEFLWVVGTDCVKDFPKWKYIDWILENVTLIVYPRPGYTYEGGLDPKHIILEGVPLIDASSTKVREGATHLLTSGVARCWERIQAS